MERSTLGFGREIDHGIEFLGGQQVRHELTVGDIAPNELVAGVA
jgi:hypothetical protein